MRRLRRALHLVLDLGELFPIKAIDRAWVVPVGGPPTERIALPATGGDLDDLRATKMALLRALVGGNPAI